MTTARVLVVDDDWDFIRRIQEAVDPVVDLRIATCEAEALAAVSAWAPQVIVLDLLLYDADGFALLERLTRPATGQSPVVLCATDGFGAGTRLTPTPDWPVGTLLRSATPTEMRLAVLSATAAPRQETLVPSG